MESDEYTGEVATDSTKLTGGSVGKERLIREFHRCVISRVVGESRRVSVW